MLASGAAYTVFTIVGGPLSVSRDGASGGRRAEGPGPMYEIGTLMVNLATNGAPGVRYVRTGVVLEADSEKTLRELERRQPQVRDRIIAVVREQTAESIAGNDGQDRLRESLVRSVNELLSEGEVVQVWFTDLVVQ